MAVMPPKLEFSTSLVTLDTDATFQPIETLYFTKKY